MARKFKLTITLDNAAFEDEANELAWILRRIATHLDRLEKAPWASQTIFDSNGNDVGRYAAKEEDQ